MAAAEKDAEKDQMTAPQDQSAPTAPPPAAAKAAQPKPPKSAMKRACDWYWDNYLPLMMIFVVFFGFLVPDPGKALDDPKIDLCTDCDLGSIKVTSSICVFFSFTVAFRWP
jgi:hypothetical protein